MKALVIGDSMIKYLKPHLPDVILGHNVQLESFPGFQIKGLMEKIKEFSEFGVIVLHIGSNDCFVDAKTNITEYEKLLQEILLKNPGCEIFITRILTRLPSQYLDVKQRLSECIRLRQWNKNVKALNEMLDILSTNSPNLHFCSSPKINWNRYLALDGVHFSRFGNDAFGQYLTFILSDYFAWVTKSKTDSLR